MDYLNFQTLLVLKCFWKIGIAAGLGNPNCTARSNWWNCIICGSFD
jgi:hypothetical protein